MYGYIDLHKYGWSAEWDWNPESHLMSVGYYCEATGERKDEVTGNVMDEDECFTHAVVRIKDFYNGEGF